MPGLVDMTERLIDAYACSTNVFMRDAGIPVPRSLMAVHEIQVPTWVLTRWGIPHLRRSHLR